MNEIKPIVYSLTTQTYECGCVVHRKDNVIKLLPCESNRCPVFSILFNFKTWTTDPELVNRLSAEMLNNRLKGTGAPAYVGMRSRMSRR